MDAKTNIINQGFPIKPSVPLQERKFGVGLGFNRPSLPSQSSDKEITIEISNSLEKRNSNLEELQNSAVSKISSPLNQALQALSDIADKIDQLQQRNSKFAGDSETNSSISNEMDDLLKEYKRITESSLFSSNSSDNPSSSLSFSDLLLRSTLDSGNQERIDSLNQGIDGLVNIDFSDALNNKDISKNIREFITQIRSALSPKAVNNGQASQQEAEGQSVFIKEPQLSVLNIGKAEGLTVSMLGFSNQDLIKAAAAHMDINSTNVLILTYNSPEPETEKEKKEREAKSSYIEIDNETAVEGVTSV